MEEKIVVEIKNLFKHHATVNEVFVTKDGKVFFKKNLAEVHAKTLGGQKPEVTKVTRDMAAGIATVGGGDTIETEVKGDTKTAEEKAAADSAKIDEEKAAIAAKGNPGKDKS